MHIRTLMLATALTLGLLTGSRARTWTSTSGSTVDAELAGRDGPFVILQRPNGSQIKIDFQKLSEADQAYLNGQEQATDAGDAPAAPAAAPGHAFGPVSFQPSPPRSTDQLPGVKPLAPANAGYLGLQFGPGPDEVLYLTVDTVDSFELPESVYLYIPHHPMYGTARKLKGKKSKHDDQRVMKFSATPVTADFGSLHASYDIEFIIGIERADVVAIMAEVKLLDTGRPSKFLLGGYINEPMLIGPGTIPVLRVLDAPELRVSVRTTTMQPTVTSQVLMGPFSVRPVGKKIEMKVVTEAGRTAEKVEHEVTEEDLLAVGHGGKRIALIDVKSATPYTLNASADMGPTIGEITVSKSFTTKGAKL